MVTLYIDGRIKRPPWKVFKNIRQVQYYWVRILLFFKTKGRYRRWCPTCKAMITPSLDFQVRDWDFNYIWFTCPQCKSGPGISIENKVSKRFKNVRHEFWDSFFPPLKPCLDCKHPTTLRSWGGFSYCEECQKFDKEICKLCQFYAEQGHFICNGEDSEDHFEYTHHCLVRTWQRPYEILKEPLKLEDKGIGAHCWDLSGPERKVCFKPKMESVK